MVLLMCHKNRPKKTYIMNHVSSLLTSPPPDQKSLRLLKPIVAVCCKTHRYLQSWEQIRAASHARSLHPSSCAQSSTYWCQCLYFFCLHWIISCKRNVWWWLYMKMSSQGPNNSLVKWITRARVFMQTKISSWCVNHLTRGYHQVCC